jgi:hypothetical protein
MKGTVCNRKGILGLNKGQPTLVHRRFRAPFLGISSRPRTTSHIGAANKRQMRSRVRSVIGFPASTFCQ